MAKKIYHWKHGWIPLTHAALQNKLGKGPAPGAKTPKGRLTSADRARITKMVRSARDGKDRAAADRSLIGKDYRSMTPAEKVRAAEIMYGKDSKQAKAVRAVMDAYAGDRVTRPSVGLEGGGYKVYWDKKANTYAIKDKKTGKVLMTTPKAEDAAKFIRNVADNDRDRQAAEDVIKQERADRLSQIRDRDVVDGVEFIAYKSPDLDPMGGDHGGPARLTHEQQQILADAYNEVKSEFPDMEPIQIVGVDGKSEAFAITSWDGRRISVSSRTFSEESRRNAKEIWGDHGAVAGQFLDDPEAFARAVLVHELGHALEMQNDRAKREGDAIALERVPIGSVQQVGPGVHPGAHYPRWEIDTLGNQSVYATTNKFEWFAESFTDAWFNGDKATAASKRVLDIVKGAYGGRKVAAA